MTTSAPQTDRMQDGVLAPAMDVDPPAGESLTPAEMAAASGVSIDTLRYYESEGLLTGVDRAANGHRRYRPEDVVWVGVLRCLRTSGMGIEQLRRYADLIQQGPETERARLEQLLAHRDEVLAHLDELREALDVINHKIDTYKAALGQDREATT